MFRDEKQINNGYIFNSFEKTENFKILSGRPPNTLDRGEDCRRPEAVKIRISPSSARRQPSRRW